MDAINNVLHGTPDTFVDVVLICTMLAYMVISIRKDGVRGRFFKKRS